MKETDCLLEQFVESGEHERIHCSDFCSSHSPCLLSRADYRITKAQSGYVVKKATSFSSVTASNPGLL